MRTVAVLGSTGSIGVQTLAVAARHPERVRVTALAAGRGLDALCAQARTVRPQALALEHPDDPVNARAALAAACPGATVMVGAGAAARLAALPIADVVVNGVVGAAGLAASVATLERGARLALANKETLVVAGPLVQALLARGGTLVPVDSEHSAVFQCLAGRDARDVDRLVITASGGALRDHPDWRRATPEEVLAHPVWRMGRRITVDSALLFNKALELIEARWLFDVPWERLEAVLHPEARVHAIVTFTDGGTLLQAAPPDMALPIQLALSWPERWPAPLAPLAAADLAGLRFAPIEPGRWPAFDLALAAGRAGGTAPCVANAADEVAVQAFLDGAIPLGAVPEIVARVLDAHEPAPVVALAQLAEVDGWAREAARGQVVRA